MKNWNSSDKVEQALPPVSPACILEFLDLRGKWGRLIAQCHSVFRLDRKPLNLLWRNPLISGTPISRLAGSVAPIRRLAFPGPPPKNISGLLCSGSKKPNDIGLERPLHATSAYTRCN